MNATTTVAHAGKAPVAMWLMVPVRVTLTTVSLGRGNYIDDTITVPGELGHAGDRVTITITVDWEQQQP